LAPGCRDLDQAPETRFKIINVSCSKESSFWICKVCCFEILRNQDFGVFGNQGFWVYRFFQWRRLMETRVLRFIGIKGIIVSWFFETCKTQNPENLILRNLKTRTPRNMETLKPLNIDTVKPWNLKNLTKNPKTFNFINF
jgi:hypothetical protein